MSKKETDLYEPIRKLLADQGFTVRGEVKGCDIAATRDDVLWVVEMKLNLNLTLIFQAMDRRTVTDWVFAAIPRPRRTKDLTRAKRLLEKLEIGLITVALDTPLRHAEIVLFPNGRANKKNKATEKVRKEIAGRTADTPGGSQTPVNTAYRERCVRIACLMEAFGSLSAKELVQKYGCEKDAYHLMRANFYKWFENVSRGKYDLSPQGREYLQENSASPLVAYYRMLIESKNGCFL